MGFITFINSLIAAVGYPIIFVGEMLEGMGIPVPGETMLIASSIYAGANAHLNIFFVVAVATLGAFTGDNIGYLIGKRGGTYLLKKYGERFSLGEKRQETLRRYFKANGGWIVFIGRFAALFRIFAPLLAGTNKMKYGKFAIYNFAGCLIWASLYGTLGYTLGKHLPLLLHILRPIGATTFIIAIIGIALSIGIFLYRDKKR